MELFLVLLVLTLLLLPAPYRVKFIKAFLVGIVIGLLLTSLWILST